MENFPSMNYYWYQNICLRWKEAKDIDQHFLLLKLTRLSNWFGGGALEFCLLWISSISWSLRQGLLLEFYKYHSTHISWVSRWINCENWSIPPLPFHISIAVLTTGDLLSSRKGKTEILKDTCSSSAPPRIFYDESILLSLFKGNPEVFENHCHLHLLRFVKSLFPFLTSPTSNPLGWKWLKAKSIGKQSSHWV